MLGDAGWHIPYYDGFLCIFVVGGGGGSRRWRWRWRRGLKSCPWLVIGGDRIEDWRKCTIRAGGEGGGGERGLDTATTTTSGGVEI